MAWYYGTYSCGHDGRVNIVGPSKDRERKKDWIFANTLCPECKQKEYQNKIQEESDNAAKITIEMNLTPLKGTEKQVRWANTIRVEFIKKFDGAITEFDRRNKDLVSRGLPPKEMRICGDLVDIEIVQSFRKYILSEYDARFWIDQRQNDFYTNLKDMYADFKKK